MANIREFPTRVANLRAYSAKLHHSEDDSTKQRNQLWDEACEAFVDCVEVLEAREGNVKGSPYLAQDTLETLSEGIVVLDEKGFILRLNSAWREIANSIHSSKRDIREGINYLTLWASIEGICAEETSGITAGIRAVLNGERAETVHEYLCDSSSGQQWFKLHAKSFCHDGAVRLVVVHHDITESKRMEERIRASEESLIQAQQVAHIGNFDWNLLTNKVRWSDEIYRLYGLSHEMFDNSFETAISYTHPDDMEHVMSFIDEILCEHKPSNINYRIVRPDQTIRIVNAQAQVYFDEEDHPIKLVGTLQDITERWQVDNELRNQKEILQTIFDHIPVMINLYGEDGQVELVNREWERVRGLNLEEMKNQALDLLPAIYPDPEYRQKVLDFISTASGEWADFTSMRNDGSVMETSWAVVPLSDGKRVSIGKDITERRRAVEILKQSERDYRTLFDQAHDAIIIFEPESGKVLNVNQPACQIYGYSKDEFVGLSIKKFSRDIQAAREEIEKIPESGQYHQFEAVHYRKDGTQMSLEINASAVEYEGQRVILSVNRDVSVRKRAQEERNLLTQRLISAQEDERRRISRELHDQMGQYLAALMMGLESLSRESQLTPRALDDLLYLKSLTAQFDNEVHRFAIELRPTALDDLGLHAALSNYVENWAKHSQNNVGADFRSIGCVAPEKRLSAEIEATLYRVVQEALTNVLKHANARHVSVILDRRPDYVRLIVEDDGSGFESDAPIDVTLRNRKLGLTSMQERIELVRGSLQVESGAGTTIVVSIPL